MDSSLKRSLLSIKEISEEASKYNKRHDSKSSIALLLYHDAVEHLLHLIKSQKGVKEDIYKFETYWNKIQNLPMKSEFIRFNKLRVNYKHYAVKFSSDEIMEASGNAERFIKTCFKDFFNTDYDDIDLGDLIDNTEFQDYYQKSKDSYKNGKLEEAIFQLKAAFYVITTQEIDDRLHKANSDYLIPRIPKKPNISDWNERHITSYMDDNNRAINNINNVLSVLLHRIDYNQYMVYRTIKPDAGVDWTGKKYPSGKNPESINLDEAYRFVKNFVVENALMIQDYLPQQQVLINKIYSTN